MRGGARAWPAHALMEGADRQGDARAGGWGSSAGACDGSLLAHLTLSQAWATSLKH